MKRRTTRCSNRPNELIRRQGTMYIMSTEDNTTDLINLHTTQCRASITSRRRPGLILTSYRFPLSLLFHNHRSLPVPIRGYHLETLITLPWLLPSPSLLTPPTIAYNMPIQLLYKRVLHYIQLHRALLPTTTSCLYSCHAQRNNLIVSSCYATAAGDLLAEWSCYAIEGAISLTKLVAKLLEGLEPSCLPKITPMATTQHHCSLASTHYRPTQVRRLSGDKHNHLQPWFSHTTVGHASRHYQTTALASLLVHMVQLPLSVSPDIKATSLFRTVPSIALLIKPDAGVLARGERKNPRKTAE